MDRQLVLYISAAAEMDAECELLGQVLANTPRAMRWIIKRTPGRGEYANPDLTVLQAADFYVILMGMDIVAPMGVEWNVARQAGITTYAYRKIGVPPSPAASVFVRDAGVHWEHYETPSQFATKIERALLTRLIEGTPGYGLDLADLEEISARLKELEEEEEESPEGARDRRGEERRGAGGGGIILPSG
ncbi:MAG TPA: hypothetical protein GX702_06500 [Chloroflexi bacterium]|jgi:hypothetical protein|nr:hypothetical protein [Chloroflexota bacterium]